MTQSWTRVLRLFFFAQFYFENVLPCFKFPQHNNIHVGYLNSLYIHNVRVRVNQTLTLTRCKEETSLVPLYAPVVK